MNRYEAAFSGLSDYIHEAVVRSYVQTAAFMPLDEATTASYRQMAQADSKHTDEVQSLYPMIATPTLILWGREDSWIPLERGEKLHGMIPGSVLRVMDDAGHLVIEERPGELAKEILGFSQA